MRIGIPEIVRDEGEVRVRALVEVAGGSDCLWYSVPSEYSDYITARTSDAFLVGLLIVAMHHNEDIHLGGDVSGTLLHNITHGYMSILKSQNPNLSEVEIIPNGLVEAEALSPGVAAGFSGGVDSFHVLADHFYSDVPQDLKITHLIYNNVGSHGEGKRHRKLFRIRYERLLPLTQRLGLPFIPIDSNLSHFYREASLGFKQSHSPRNVSAVLNLQDRVGTYLLASTSSYPESYIRPGRDISRTDPMALPLLRTSRMQTIGIGGQYGKVEKTAIVGGIQDSYDTLDVCVNTPADGGNCSRCYKCMQTLLALDVAGRIHHYDKSFDLEYYKKHRTIHTGRVLSGRHAITSQIKEYAKQRNYSFPLRSRILGYTKLMLVLAWAEKLKRKLITVAKGRFGQSPARAA